MSVYSHVYSENFYDKEGENHESRIFCRQGTGRGTEES